MGAPATYPKILAYLKANEGKFVTTEEIKEKTGVTAGHSFRAIASRDLPKNVLIQPSGKGFIYKFVHSAEEADPRDGVDALILLRYGTNQAVEFKIEHARQIYLQLHRLFGVSK